jgi:hypothetical protein
MKSSVNTRRGLSITSVIVAVVALGLATGGVVKYVQSTGQYRRQLYTRTQENSYRVFQNEIAVTGANPTAMTHNPLAATLVSRQDGVTGTNSYTITPYVSMATSAGRNQAGSAQTVAYASASGISGRSGSLGYRITATTAAVTPPTATQLSSPSFRISGVVPEAEFSPNLTNLLLASGANPPGTVYRYTIDGSNPTASSPIWTASTSLPACPLPSVVKAAAFNSDPQYSTSPIVIDGLSRSLTMNYARSGGGSSTSFSYADVSAGTNGIVLSIANAPSGTQILYSYDGSLPSIVYSGAFQVPLAYWSAAVPIRALAVTGQGNINVTALSTTITPQSTPLPSPTFGTPGGSITSVTLPVADTIPTAVIRYAIDMAITSGSPTITNGSSITVTAP